MDRNAACSQNLPFEVTVRREKQVNHCPLGQAFGCVSSIYSVYESLV